MFGNFHVPDPPHPPRFGNFQTIFFFSRLYPSLRLLESISKLEHFRKFLETAVNQSGGEFLEVKQMIDRIMILVEIRLLISSIPPPSSPLTVRLISCLEIL